MSDPVTTSLILTTFKRPDMMAAALRSIARSTGVAREQIEVLVVDNNSGDRTKDAFDAIAKGYPFALSYLLEVKPGVSNARNAGAAAARGRFLAFMDDDQQIDPGYLARIPDAFAETGGDCVGGWTGYVDSECFPPWMSVVIQRLGARDFGDRMLPIGAADPKLQGGNMAFTREAFARIGGFDPEYLRVQDVEIQERLLRQGGSIFYDPGLRQNHYLDPRRLSRRYFLGRAYQNGRIVYQRTLATWNAKPHFFGVPRLIWGQLVDDLARLSRASGPGERFNRIYNLFGRLGQIHEALSSRLAGVSQRS